MKASQQDPDALEEAVGEKRIESMVPAPLEKKRKIKGKQSRATIIDVIPYITRVTLIDVILP